MSSIKCVDMWKDFADQLNTNWFIVTAQVVIVARDDKSDVHFKTYQMTSQGKTTDVVWCFFQSFLIIHVGFAFGES